MQEGVSTFVISWTQGFLVLITLLCCVGCLWMVFFFGRQIQTSAYVRNSLVVAVKAEELDNLMRELQAKRLSGWLDQKKPPPFGFEREAQFLWRDDGAVKGAPSPEAPYLSGDLKPEARQALMDQYRRERDAEEEAERQRRAPFERWAEDERERYAVLCEAAERQAQANAESRVPRTMDIALLGGGWSFLLEFSTVIVILFILLCLGILNAITGRDSVTILASIAGYVLGKASANAPRGQPHERTAGGSASAAAVG